MLDTHTKLLGVIGDPIAHSLSPALHNFLIEQLNLNCRYLAFQVGGAQLPAAVKGLKALGVGGFNVTVPHKQTVVPLLDELTPEAHMLGAVNTVAINNGRSTGHNTDWVGFLKPLQLNLNNENVVLLGAGGAAQAVAYALGQLNIGRLTIANRSTVSAKALADNARRAFELDTIDVVEWQDKKLANTLASSALLVNSTSVGMWPHEDQSPIPAEWLNPELSVYDLVYRPLETRLLRDAKQCGASTIDGLGMLIGQGVAALELWTGATVSDALTQRLRGFLINL